jgi:hypothetical protein
LILDEMCIDSVNSTLSAKRGGISIRRDVNQHYQNFDNSFTTPLPRALAALSIPSHFRVLIHQSDGALPLRPRMSILSLVLSDSDSTWIPSLEAHLRSDIRVSGIISSMQVCVVRLILHTIHSEGFNQNSVSLLFKNPRTALRGSFFDAVAFPTI